MKKVLLISQAGTADTRAKAEEFTARLNGMLKADGIAITSCKLADVCFEISPEAMSIYHPVFGFDLKDFDLVIIRVVGNHEIEAHTISLYCKYQGVECVDTYLGSLLLDDKLSMQATMWVGGMKKTPKTLFGPTAELAKRFSEFGEKAIFKDNEGSKGRHNFVVSSPADIEKITTDYPDKRFLLQEFIPNDGDLRVLVMNDQPRLVIRRTSDGSSHLNNTSQGGSAELVPLSAVAPDILEACRRAAKELKLEVAGADVIINTKTGEFSLLEINNAPQIISGSFVDEKAIEYAQFIKEVARSERSGHTERRTVGWMEQIDFPELGATSIDAKIDTGAYSGALHCTDMRVVRRGPERRRVLKFNLLGRPDLPREIEDFETTYIRSATGHRVKRYVIRTKLRLQGILYDVKIGLSDRSDMRRDALIGRRFLRENNIIVDVGIGADLDDEGDNTK